MRDIWAAASTVVAAGCALFLLCPRLAQAEGAASQTDWSGGSSTGGVVVEWGRDFASTSGISWLALPGRMTLQGAVLDEPIKRTVDGEFERPASLDVVDLDGDGDLDLVGAAIGGDEIRWWRDDGGGSPVWVPITIDDAFTGAASVLAEDLDGDGVLDIAGCGWVNNEIAVWYAASQGGSWTKQTVATEFAACHWVDAADLDDDGDLDLLGAAADGNEVAVWINSGDPNPGWDHQIVEMGYRGARSLVPADLDADGDVDLIGTALLDNDVSWWRNDGGEPLVWTRSSLTGSLDGAHHADAWDIDLDGDLDVLAAGFGSPFLVLWRNDGSDPPGWIEESFGAPIVAPLVVDVGDLDGDGDLDVVATSNAWGRVVWWHNDGGSPAGWPATYIGVNFTNAWPVAIADLDGNGALDLVAGASGATEVASWRLTEFIDTGVIESRVLSIPDDMVSLTCRLEAVAPAGTGVEVEIRLGPDPDNLGPWTVIEPFEEIHLMERGPTHLQYRLVLTTSDRLVAPVVEKIAFDWSSELVPRRSPGGRRQP